MHNIDLTTILSFTVLAFAVLSLIVLSCTILVYNSYLDGVYFSLHVRDFID